MNILNECDQETLYTGAKHEKTLNPAKFFTYDFLRLLFRERSFGKSSSSALITLFVVAVVSANCHLYSVTTIFLLKINQCTNYIPSLGHSENKFWDSRQKETITNNVKIFVSLMFINNKKISSQA